MPRINRRHFIAGASSTLLASGTIAGGSWVNPAARAADGSGYKALVCLFLLGGMDHNDFILPYDQPSYTALSNAREELFDAYRVGSGNSSRDRDNLLPLNPDNAAEFGSRRFAFPPQLAPLQTMFDERDLAIVGGVGTLIERVTRMTFDNGEARLPPQLFSHNDQQSVWQTFSGEGATTGWGGQFIDAALRTSAGSDPRFSAITTDGNIPFLFSPSSTAFNLSPGGPPGLDIINRRYLVGNGTEYDITRDNIRRYLERIEFGSRNIFERDFSRLQGESIAAGSAFADFFNAGQVTTVFPDTRLGDRLRAIANTINLQGNLNVNRQIFYAAQGGFDTHSDQTRNLPTLHQEIADAVSAFRAAMIEIGMWDNVTLFSASDFGRTLGDNGDGSDHGWGGHHFVAGGAVRGKRIYGTIAPPNEDDDAYTPSRGRLIPSISVQQYAATLGRWFGLDEDELLGALPGLENFTTRDLELFGPLQASATLEQEPAPILVRKPGAQPEPSPQNSPPVTSRNTRQPSREARRGNASRGYPDLHRRRGIFWRQDFQRSDEL